MKSLSTALVLSLLTIVPAFAQSVEKFRDDFVATFGDQCLKTQRSAAQNASLPDAVIVKYCGCVTRHAPDEITMDDLMELSRTGKRGRELQMKLNAMGDACLAWMKGEVNDPTADAPKVKR